MSTPESEFIVWVDRMDGDVIPNEEEMTRAIAHAFKNGAKKVCIRKVNGGQKAEGSFPRPETRDVPASEVAVNPEADAQLAGATGSAVPDKAGFYWWRPSPLHMWHMVHIQDHAEGIRKTPYLVAYDVSFSSFYGRDLKSWKEFFDVGEWVCVTPPNAV